MPTDNYGYMGKLNDIRFVEDLGGCKLASYTIKVHLHHIFYAINGTLSGMFYGVRQNHQNGGQNYG